ncbi:hypothetical protein TRFO_27814 [Tritrichomonas foetus]|uniref:Protein kinase domain-containing protein n=1 Tax=Tritrichomonas foetus TaxID=1144522 RepID=A0A1J4K5B6_9EUKA|nr:hypothetical protein TRFO_27814 [Tritrichomonas foetus]|eukprot:OHT04661.1 hypothetical protein TRFO_27814 [Tritrichomonas foetus]
MDYEVDQVVLNNIVYDLDWEDNTAYIINSPDAEGDVKIPRAIKVDSQEFDIIAIGQKAFQSSKKINSISFSPNSMIEEFEDSAFSGSPIREISFSPNMPLYVLSSFCFYRCINLTHVFLPPSVETVGSHCFASTNLQSLECEAESLEFENSFDECIMLKRIYLPKVKKLKVSHLEFNNVHRKFKLIIPENCKFPSVSTLNKAINIEYIKTYAPDNAVSTNQHAQQQPQQSQPQPPQQQQSQPQPQQQQQLLLQQQSQPQQLLLLQQQQQPQQPPIESSKVVSNTNTIIKNECQVQKNQSPNKQYSRSPPNSQNLLSQNQRLKSDIRKFVNRNKILSRENEILHQKLTKLRSQIKIANESLKNHNCMELLSDDKMNVLSKVDKISEGSTSKLVKIMKEETFVFTKRKIYTQKIFKDINEENFASVIQQNEIIAKIRHPCILKVVGFNKGYEQTDIEQNKTKKIFPSILFPYQQTTLEQEITKLNNTEKANIILELVIGLQYIQEKCHLIHKNLKPSNILLNEKHSVKICDFGITADLSSKATFTKSIESLQFMAPELLNELEYNEKIDQYSFGKIVNFIVMNGEYPRAKLIEIMTGKGVLIHDSVPPFVQQLIYECCSYDPNYRPSFTMILNYISQHNYAFFPNVDVNMISSRHSYLIHRESQLCNQSQ